MTSRQLDRWPQALVVAPTWGPYITVAWLAYQTREIEYEVTIWRTGNPARGWNAIR